MSPGTGDVTRGQALAGAGIFALLLFILLPASQYLGNLGEFVMAPGPLALVLAGGALLFLGGNALVLRLVGATRLGRFASIVAALTLLMWLQSYLLVWDYGLLDGREIDWSTPWWRGWIDLPIWAAGLFAAWRWHRRIGGTLRVAAAVVVALQAVAVASDAFARRDVLALKPTLYAASNEAEAMARFSSQRNVLHIVLDSFQAEIFKDIIEGPAREYFVPRLPGFTFFEEQLGTFPATHFALPNIVSGEVYRNHMPQAAFMEHAFGGRSILNAAHDAGFEVDLASDPRILSMLMKGRFDNAYVTSRAPLAEEAAQLLDLALFRAAPHWLKPVVHADQRWLVRRFTPGPGLLRFKYFAHNAFLVDITRNFAVDRPRPVYKFFHLMTTHAPMVVNPDCSYAGQVLPRVRETVLAQSQCSLSFVIPLLERMRQAGIYDDSLIVLLGDHGGHVPPRRLRENRFTQDGAAYELAGSLLGLATPLLAVKPPGAKGPLRVSTAHTSTTDVAATIDALLGLGAGLPGRSVMEPREPGVERFFYGYMWSKADSAADYISEISQYRVTGSAYDIDSWHIGETYLPPTGAAASAPAPADRRPR